MLAKHLNVTHYLICFIPNDTTDDVSLLKNITISSMDDFNGIVFNPGSIGWDISLEHISSLLKDIRHSN